MQTIQELFRRFLDTSGAGNSLTLDPALQGLPGTAHGGSVLAVFDAAATLGGTRRIRGLYRRRVPLGVPLTFETKLADGAATCCLCDGAIVLVEGQVTAGALPEAAAPDRPVEAMPLPVSSTCFVCGRDNAVGLRAQLSFDETRVTGPAGLMSQIFPSYT